MISKMSAIVRQVSSDPVLAAENSDATAEVDAIPPIRAIANSYRTRVVAHPRLQWLRLDCERERFASCSRDRAAGPPPHRELAASQQLDGELVRMLRARGS